MTSDRMPAKSLSPEMAEFVYRVLKATSFDYCDALFWRTDQDRDHDYAPIEIMVGCNDFFAWACADAEEVTPDNVSVLEQAIADCEAVDDHVYGPLLFCARMRQCRPQGAAYPDDAELAALFDACGPTRAVGFGNPKAPPVFAGAGARIVAVRSRGPEVERG